jgi:hypothetical protein
MAPLRNSQESTPPQAGPAPAAQPQRPRRADARRNYESLLAAATEVFGEHGVHAPLDEIARRARVGNATMYRHFPTRQELILAVYAATPLPHSCDEPSKPARSAPTSTPGTSSSSPTASR